MEGCHYWDSILREKFPQIISKIVLISINEEESLLQNLLKTYENTRFYIPLKRMINSNNIDQNINYRVRLLVSQTWFLIKDNKDYVQIFESQIDDMINSSGYCEQGWSNRMIQILFGCEKIVI